MKTGFSGGAPRRGKRRRRQELLAAAIVLSGVCLGTAAVATTTAGAQQISDATMHAGPVSAALSSLGGRLQGLLVGSGGSCSWRTQYGNGGDAALETDTNAAYWATSFLALPGGGMTIQGTFPQARNMSFTVYHTFGAVEGGHLYDAQIQPDSGVNPFQDGQTGAGTYTLYVVPGNAPADPAANTLYTDSIGPVELELVYRVYDPTDAGNPAGDAPLPQTTTTFDGKPVSVNQPCVDSSGQTAPGAPAVGPGSATPRLPRLQGIIPAVEPNWVTSKISAIFADPDNAYLSARIDSLFGQLVVFRAQMPTFPDTNAGFASWDPGQVRYWSVCANNGLLPHVTGCAADFNAVQSGGIATFVVSSPANQPPNATAADGVNWLPWGSGPSGIIIYRQMLADPAFAQSIAAVPAGGSPETTMGSYLPQIAYCSEAEFAAAGADGCLGSG